MKIIRMELTPNDISSPDVRYDTDCACVQSCVAGSWVDNPAADPRTSPAFALPAPSGVDQKCNAATGITDNFKSGLDASLSALNATGNALAVGSVVLNILDFLAGIGVIAQLFVDFGALVLGIGTTAVNAVFTDSVYAELACTLYCDSSADGTFTETQFDQVLTDIASSFGEFSTVNIVLNSWLNNLGFVGLSNVGIQKAISGDCSDCACEWCYTWDFTLSDGGWTSPAVATYTPGVGWVGHEYDANSNTHCEIKLTFPMAGEVTSFSYTGCKPTGSGSNNATLFELLLGGTDVYDDIIGIDEGCPVSNEVTMDVTADTAIIALNAGTSGGATTISSVTMRGLGTNPFGTDNC